MISSPMFAQSARLSTSPTGSPTLRPAVGVMAQDDERSSRANRRPYCSPRMSRSRSRPRGQIDDATTAFANTIAQVARARKARAAELGVNPAAASPASPSREHRAETLIELLVDVPVWSAGCFADLSTLHALRDNTLARVHGLVFHLNETHALQVTYRLLAKRPCCVAWGAIRISPSPLDGPGVSCPARRTSFVQPEREGSGGVPSPPRRLSGNGSSSALYENALTDSDSEHSVDLHSGCEDEDESSVTINKEIQRRKEREGAGFVLDVKGDLHLIVV